MRMDTPQLAFGFEEPESQTSKKMPFPAWGVICRVCDGIEEYMAQSVHKADWNYQNAAQNLAESRLRFLRVKTRRSQKKALARMMRLHKVVISLRRESHAMQDMMFEARDRKTVCFSEYGYPCASLKQVF